MTASRYRGSLAVWALLLAYASLYPFFPLRSPSPEAIGGFFLTPRYITRADLLFNVIAYVPLGTLACLYFRHNGATHPIARAVGLAAGLSVLMEIMQLYVPNRVSTIIDVICNAAGALLGALAFVEPAYSLAAKPLGVLRERMIIAGAWGDAGLVLLVLWLIAQLNPALPFFGAGNIGGEGRPQEPMFLQWVGVGLSICGFGLFVSALMHSASLRVTLVLLSIALWLKFAMASMLLQPHFAEEWLSVGRVAGLTGGLLLFVPLRKRARPMRVYLALVTILAGALFSKIFGAYSPVDELLRLFRWPHGQLGSFATLTRFLHELWPVAAIAFLVALFIHERRVRE
jgi:VanZ family protein